MKVCSKCHKELPLTDFYANKKLKSGYSSWCKMCCRTDSKLYYERNPKKRDWDKRKKNYSRYRRKKMAFVEELKTPCAKCGTTVPYVLNFHHIDHNTKLFDLGKAYTRKYEDIIPEVNKCICLCYNCHHTYHYFYGMQPVNPKETLNEFLSADWTPPIKESIL